jgi:steroid delta-isomerase-like uncharacterized protein
MGTASETVSRYFQALSAGDVDGAVGLIADGGDFRTPMGAMTGRGAIRLYLSAFEEAFPKADYVIDTVIESGRTVAAEGTYRGTHRGPMHLPDCSVLEATGRNVSAPFVTMFDVAEGEIFSHRPYWDLAGFMAQLKG